MVLVDLEQGAQSFPLALRDFQQAMGGKEELYLEESRRSWRQRKGRVGKGKEVGMLTRATRS